jgi:hypothetical protein
MGDCDVIALLCERLSQKNSKWGLTTTAANYIAYGNSSYLGNINLKQTFGVEKTTEPNYTAED